MADITSREFQDIAKTVPGIIYQFCIDTETGQQYFPYVSPTIHNLLGIHPQDVMNDAITWIKQIHGEDMDNFTATVGESMATMKPWFWEGRMSHVDGTVRWLRGESIPTKEDNIITWSGIVGDITRQHNIEEELRSTHKELEKRVKERTSELEVALAQAKVANKAKVDFLSNMSHELRTPLNAISGFGQLLQMSELSQIQKDYANEIINAGDYLLHLIKDILDLNKIEAGQIEFNKESIKLNTVVDSAITLIKNHAEKKNITIKNNLKADNNLYLYTDEFRCKEIIINFLSNAIKYNKKDGSVTINAFKDSKQIKITVTDTGCGISKNQQKNAFLPFERLGKEGSAIEGTGIGLSISKKLATGLGGSVGLQSTEEEGSTFWVKLPASSTTPIQKETLVEEKKKMEHTEDKNFTLLYIEDNPANLKLVQNIIKDRFTINMVSASTAEQGLKMARQFMPDLILMDINLPDISGNEAIKILKTDKNTNTIPVFALSANAMKSDISKSLELGFKEYITKPFNIPDFISTISREISK